MYSMPLPAAKNNENKDSINKDEDVITKEEVIDIVKKNGAADAVEKEDLRKHLVEEMADVLMYYNDVMLCYGITAEELKAAYTEKFEKNMKRW